MDGHMPKEKKLAGGMDFEPFIALSNITCFDNFILFCNQDDIKK